MQALLLPAAPPGGTSPAMPSLVTPKLFSLHLHWTPRLTLLFGDASNLSSSRSSFSSQSSFTCIPLSRRRTAVGAVPISTAYAPSSDDSEKANLAQVSKRLESTSRYFRRLGDLGFWGQLICTVVAAVILSFSVVVTGRITSPATFYATAGGITAGFISVFWSFGYIRLSEKLWKTANQPSKAPPRADVVKSLKNGIILNLLGMGAAVLGMQATVGLLVAKALTSSANLYKPGVSPAYSPVLALDVFLVQASANTILSHFLGLVFSLELLRSVTLPPSNSIPVPRLA